MSRVETIAAITARLDELSEEDLAGVARLLDDLTTPSTPSDFGLARELTPRELALLEQSKADFREGRTYSLDEASARTTALLAARRAARGKT